ncbi:MAG TPA: GvpL/GvpF family gas vesicle protein [Acidimicrobiales bacterium]
MRDEDVLRRLNAALRGRSARDVEAILDRAYRAAVDEATATLEELITRSLLARAADRLAAEEAAEAAAPEGPGSDGLATDTPAPARTASEWAWYVYGIQPQDAEPPVGVTGVLGAEVDGLEAAGLRALVSRVPRVEVDEPALRARLEDLDWVDANARAHEAVLAGALAAGPVVPLSFGTVFHDRPRVAAVLRRHAEKIRAAVDGLAGRSEWGVKALVDTAACDAWLAERAERGAAAASPGADPGGPGRAGRSYLAQRAAERRTRDERHRLLLDLAAEAHGALSELAVDACTDPPQNPELSGHEGEMILNGAYLLDDAAVEAFHRRAGELASRHAGWGLTVQVTGPWPPHHFVALPPLDDDDGDDDDGDDGDDRAGRDDGDAP